MEKFDLNSDLVSGNDILILENVIHFEPLPFDGFCCEMS